MAKPGGVTLSPSLFVILNEVKDLEGLRINFGKGLVLSVFLMERRDSSPPAQNDKEDIF
jgi:hypothetical protein